MTMRVVVENTDSARTLRIKVRGKLSNGQLQDAETLLVPPGNKADVWLHSAQDCVMEEVQ